MCGGASNQQVMLEREQAGFYDSLRQEYQQVFGEHQAILGKLTSAFEPILAAGPNQEGFSAPEKQALNTQADEGVGNNYANAAKAVNASIAAEGGGNEFLPSGANEQFQGELATAAARQKSAEELGIVNADYATGRANFYNAATALGGALSASNPLGYSSNAISAGNSAYGSATQNYQENLAASQNLINTIGGGITGALGGGLGIPV